MKIILPACVTVLLALLHPFDQEKGQVLPPWAPGVLDIHHISTGLGNATFIRLPGGATLLVDAGGANRIPYADPKPNDTKRPGEWIADYVASMAGAGTALDYAVMTHFHPDHIGGLADVAAAVPIRRLIDRGSPSYAYLKPADTDAVFKAYQGVLASQPSIKAETAAVGSTQQIVDRGEATNRATVRVIAANDKVWTGTGNEVKTRFPALASISDAADRPTENMCSVALRIGYGAFDYFTGGDMPGYPTPGGPTWHDLESDIARAMGQTDARQVGHHGSIEVENPFFLSTVKSRVLVLPAWSPTHPSPDVLKRMLSTRIYPDPRDVFVVQFREPTRATIGARANQVASADGHVVIRVEPGGARYRVFMLDNTTPERRITSVHGPYDAVK
jgi:beta-lactamase superfamily II metal-dependent hydrolase